MSGNEWLLTYRVPNEEFGWQIPCYEQIRVSVTLSPDDAVAIERVMHRLAMLAVDADAQARWLEAEVHRLRSRTLWQRIRGDRRA
jgi:hypothetical protein